MNPPPPSGGERRVGYPRARGATARAKPPPPRRLGFEVPIGAGQAPVCGDRTRVRPVPRHPPLSLSPFFPKRGLPDVGSVSPRSRPAGGASLFSFGSTEEGVGGGNRKDGIPGWESGRGRGPDQAVRVWGAPDRPTAGDGGGRAAPREGLPKRGGVSFLVSFLRERGRENGNDPSAGSPTETLLRLLLPLNDQV